MQNFIEQLKKAGLYSTADFALADIPEEALRKVPADVAVKFQVLPLYYYEKPQKLILVTDADRFEKAVKLTADIENMLECSVQMLFADKLNVQGGICAHYKINEDQFTEKEQPQAMVITVGEDEETGDKTELEKQEQSEEEKSQIVQMVNSILEAAAADEASDIHILPTKSIGNEESNVTFRIMGRLEDYSAKFLIPGKIHPNIVGRIKGMCLPELDTGNVKVPQNGSFVLKRGGTAIDVRVSILPTKRGEKIVMRLLNTANVPLDMESLGFKGEELEKYRRMLMRPDGMIIIAGPTGQGKSTTMYASLKHFDGKEYNVSTVEDPVEYNVRDFAQVSIKYADEEKVSLTWPKVAKALLRQDPDIWVLGEMRDAETARAAVEASQTGHRVFSTFHARNIVTAIDRMLMIGIDKRLLLNELRVVISQRLVLTQCPDCLNPHMPDEQILMMLSEEERTKVSTKGLLKSKGCPKCSGKGYTGRTVIAEFLFLNNEIRDFFAQNNGLKETEAFLKKIGFKSMWEKGMELVYKGKITLEEFVRVIPQNDD